MPLSIRHYFPSARVVLLIRFWHPDVPAGEYTARKKELDRAFKRHTRAAMMPPLF